jgi:hypothetical protein
MVRFKRKFQGITVFENWFQFESGFTNFLLPNAFLHVKNVNQKPAGYFSDVNHTIENSLLLGQDEIFAAFNKALRQQIKQSEGIGMTCYFHTNYESFVQFFNDFAIAKGLAPTSMRRMNELKEYLQMSYVECNGDVLAAHSYLVDEKNKIVRIYHSASRRIDEAFDRTLIGKANKLLHYKDMMAYKQQGFEVYDFGGYSFNTEDKELLGINNFKLLFGGNVVECKNYYSFSYSLMRKIGQAIGALGKA